MTQPMSMLLVVPANNTSMAPEMRALLPEVSDLDVVLVKRPPKPMQAKDIPAYIAWTSEALEPYRGRRFDLAVFGCNAAGFLAGPAGNGEIMALIADRTRSPVVSTATAMVEAMRHCRLSRTTVVTPYLPEVNNGLVRHFAAGGIQVDRLESFLCETTEALARIDDAQVMATALGAVTADSASLFIACTQLPTFGIIRKLRQQLGLPVWSAVQATAWSAARALAAKGQPMSLLVDPALAA